METEISYQDLNAQLNIPENGAINIRADKAAARAYHLQYVNKHTRIIGWTASKHYPDSNQTTGVYLYITHETEQP